MVVDWAKLHQATDENWVQPYQANSWVRLLSKFGGELPLLGKDDPHWARFVSVSASAPIVLVLLGTCAAAVVPLVLCRCHPQAKGFRGGPPWPHFVLACALTLVSFGIGAFLCWDTTERSFTSAGEQLRRAVSDVSTVDDLAKALKESGRAVIQDLDALYVSCPPDIELLVGGSVSEIKGDVSRYMRAVRRFSDSVEKLPAKLEAIERTSTDVGTLIAWCLALPTLAVIGSAVAVAAAVSAAECSGPKCARRCEHCQLPCLGAFCIGPAIFLVAVITGVELSVGILSSAVCGDVDQTAMDVAEAQFGLGSDGFNMTRYYVAGQGTNPAFEQLEGATARIASAQDWVATYSGILARSCIQWNPANLSMNLQAVQGSIAESALLLLPHHLYPYYRSAAHEIVCGSAVSSLGWLVLLQSLLGFVCLPALVCTASCLVKGLAAERQAGYTFDLLAQEERGFTEDWVPPEPQQPTCC